MKLKKINISENFKGFLFILPLLFGLIYFFIIPVVKSFLFSVTDVNFGASGYSFGDFVGIEHYKSALLTHTKYRQTVVSAMLEMLLTAPLIMVFSFFMASVLNNKFRGQTFFKIMMFIPIVTSLASSTSMVERQMDGFSGYNDTFAEPVVSFTKQISQYLLSIGLSEDVSNSIISIADQVYGVINDSGIQILIMIVGMCSISPLLYEAATVEGATAWESFWKITVPMASPTIYVCLVYTIIDSFTSDNNGLISLISDTSFNLQNYSLASAMGWIYFLIVVVILGTVSLLISRYLFYYDK